VEESDSLIVGSTTPKLAIIGGRLEDDNAAVYDEMRRLSGGRIVVFATASSVPDEVGPETVAVFRAHGFDAVLAGVHGAGAARAARTKAVADLVEDYGSVYFTGGDQTQITKALAPRGRESRVLKAIRAAQLNGGLAAGSSAGAAMMSDVMISGGTSLEAATYGVVVDPTRPGMLLTPGLGFFSWGLVDQHFIKRGRFGRLVVGMQASGAKLGFGIDENTALFVEGTIAHVIGEYGAFVLDLGEANADADQRLIENIGFSYADNGDSCDLETGEDPARHHLRRPRPLAPQRLRRLYALRPHGAPGAGGPRGLSGGSRPRDRAQGGVRHQRRDISRRRPRSGLCS
jgi:cyanophycinase